jgi:predicted dehydrogenase
MAMAFERQFGHVPNHEKADSLVERKEIDLIYIASPPFLHHAHALAALKEGKHVLCEKPLGINCEQTEAIVAAARESDLLAVANLMQRYNPVYDLVHQVVESKILGEVLHGYFENYASDEKLSAEHWFWDPAKSGGIFVEHGVHFFDMFEGWLGPGKAVAAQRVLRPESQLEEQVQCTVRYEQGALVNFYHGFHQPARLDRQETRLLFERGDIRLGGWVPTRLVLNALADDKAIEDLSDMFPDALASTTPYSAGERACCGRHKVFAATAVLRLKCGKDVRKETRYGEALKAMLEDQWAWIRDRRHQRRVTEENGRRSVEVAAQAKHLADEDTPPWPAHPENNRPTQ